VPIPDLNPENILVVDDEPDFVRGVRDTLARAGYQSLGANDLAEARRLLDENCVDLLLIDEWLGRETGTRFLCEVRVTEPGLPSVIMSGHADLEMALKAMRAGAIDMLPKPFTGEELVETVGRNLGETALVREARRHRWYANRNAVMTEIVGQSPATQKLVEGIRRVASTDSTVLIQGESGTGKELVARAIHAASPRKHRDMVSENFGSLTPTLVEAALFGVKKGAYTGADADRPGLFEVANGSTLFLDEVGEMPPEVQVRLLRVLEERTVTRLGETKPRKVDVRLIGATHKDLREETESGNFRSDLYYRLNVLRLNVAPLRERPEDIEPIARHLLADLNRKQSRRIKGFDAKAIEKLRQHHWPGNVRELRNVVESAVVYADTDWIGADDLDIDRRGYGGRFESALELPHQEAIGEFNKRYFRRLLQRADGNKSRAAEMAGIDRTNLYKHLKRAGIEE